jgi:hypothetical protein
MIIIFFKLFFLKLINLEINNNYMKYNIFFLLKKPLHITPDSIFY